MSLVRSFIIINIAEIFFIASGYIIHSSLGRMLDPSDYGRYSIIVSLAMTVIFFVGDGVPKALSKYISQYPEKEKIIKKKAALAQLLLIIVISIIYYFSASLIAGFLEDKSLIPYIKLSTLIIPAFASASFYNNYFNGLKKFGLQATQRTIRSIARVSAIVSLAYFFGVTGAIIGYILAPIFVFLYSFTVDKYRKKDPDLVQKGNFPLKVILSFGIEIVIFMVAYQLLNNAGIFLVKKITGEDYWAGIYNTVMVIGQIPFYFFSNFAILLLPTISNILEKKTVKVAQEVIRQSMRYIFILLFPAVASVIIFSDQIIRLLYSSDYSPGNFALKFYVVGIGAFTVYYICSFILNGSNNVRTSIYLTWIGVVINVGLNYILIPRFGILGAAISIIPTAFLLMTISIFYTQRIFGNFINYLTIFRSFVGAAAVSVLFYKVLLPNWQLRKELIINDFPNLSFIPYAVLFFVIYFIILFLLKEVNMKDFSKMKQVFMKKSKKNRKRFIRNN
ncbi:MAG: oligosaccharide flippase family protein [Candidatus Moranbacteria bacterium]|nr:oligosaccharide flippase family protein [Candidatus Moranbacteria bacterium]